MLTQDQTRIISLLVERGFAYSANGIGAVQVFNPWDVFPDPGLESEDYRCRTVLEGLRAKGMVKVDHRLGGLAYYLTPEVMREIRKPSIEVERESVPAAPFPPGF